MAPARVRARRVRGWVALPALTAVVAFAPVSAEAVDQFYSRGLYPLIQRAGTFVSNLVPLALLDIFLVVVVVLAAVRLVALLNDARSRGVMDAFLDGTKRIARTTAAVVLVFLLAWGLNYRRLPLTAVVTGTPPPSTAVLEAAVSDANALAASLRPALVGDPEPSYADIAAELADPMQAALANLSRPGLSTPGRPKFSLILSPFFAWAGVSGMINPLALESIVDPDLLPIERPFVLAHEWAHLSGHADEAEANAVGWLACMKGGPALAYSASLYLILEAAGELPAGARRTALATLDNGVRGDLELIAARVRRQQQPRVQQAAFKVYDGYLKANQVEDGVKSYGRALTLILSSELRGALDDYRAVR